MTIDIINLNKSYGKKEVLKDISFSLKCGIYGLLGPNGAGKSTLIKLLTGNIEADSGEILWNGQSISENSREYLSNIGYAPQGQSLYNGFTAWQYLDYIACLKDIPKTKREEEIKWALEHVELINNSNERLGIFSGGMKQRIMLAQAILGQPNIIILDEPMNGLDPEQRIRVRQIVQKLAERSIVLIATHIVADIESMKGTVLILHNGTLVCNNSVEVLCKTVNSQGMNTHSLEDVYKFYCSNEVVFDD